MRCRDGAGCPTGDCLRHPTGAGDLTTLPLRCLSFITPSYRFHSLAATLERLIDGVPGATAFKINIKFIVGCYRRAITENLLQLVEIVQMAVRHTICCARR